jgi:hypothetical protein
LDLLADWAICGDQHIWSKLSIQSIAAIHSAVCFEFGEIHWFPADAIADDKCSGHKKILPVCSWEDCEVLQITM